MDWADERVDPAAAEQARLAAEHARLRATCAEAVDDLRVYRQACPLPSVILAGLDAVFGGLRAVLEKRFDSTSFVSGFFVNAALAALLAYTGDRLGVNLFLAAVVALGVRIFYNLGFIPLLLLKRPVPARAATVLGEPPPP